jgi:N-acetylmuramoyl-L-alanine amidase
MSRASRIKGQVQHCSAGFAGVHGIEDWWRNGLGWKSKGYATITDVDGTIYYLDNNNAKYGYTTKYNNGKCFGFVTNGVKGYNSNYIHHCYIGGVERTNVNKAKDTRTDAQKHSMEVVLKQGLLWLKDNGKDITKDLCYVGHRDFSKDNNSNGVIEPHERIKECPSYDVIGSIEHYLYSSNDRYGKLPYN